MITVIIKDDSEPTVTKMTYENLYKELKDIPDSKLIVASDWFKELDKVKTPTVCFVEADCLVNSGYFSSLIGLYKKNDYSRRIAVMASRVGVNNWANTFYGYEIGSNWSDGVIPVKDKKSSAPYPVQIAYIPGSVMRMSRLLPLLDDLNLTPPKPSEDLIKFSTDLSLGFWRTQGRVNINPNTTYVSTENYVNDVGRFDAKASDLINMFKKESI